MSLVVVISPLGRFHARSVFLVSAFCWFHPSNPQQISPDTQLFLAATWGAVDSACSHAHLMARVHSERGIVLRSAIEARSKSSAPQTVSWSCVSVYSLDSFRAVLANPGRPQQDRETAFRDCTIPTPHLLR